jgi:drug/metabolite transporter (DMT)-like permease
MRAFSMTKATDASATVRWDGIGYLFLTGILWGINWPVTKFILTELPPLSTRAIAGIVGAAITLAVAAVRQETLLPPAGQWPRLLIAAGLNFTAWMGLTTVSLLWLRASETVIIAYTLPIWAALLARPLLGERLTATRFLGMLLGLGGVALLLAAEPQAQSWMKLPGVALALAGSMLFALGAVLSKRAPLMMPPVAAVSWQIGLGSVPLLLGMLFEQPRFGALDAAGGLALAGSGALALGAGYLTWFAALRRLPASLVTIGSLLVPVVGVSTAAVMLGEPLGWRECGALALTLCGVVIASRRVTS